MEIINDFYDLNLLIYDAHNCVILIALYLNLGKIKKLNKIIKYITVI